MDSILNFQEKYMESDAIKSYEYNEYQPTSGSNINIPGNITIHIENQDEFYHPRRSYLLVEGNLMKEDGARYAAADTIAQANNGVMHLFSNVKYELAGQEIESVNNPGIAGVLMGIAKYPMTTRMELDIGWRVDGKSFREAEGVYHCKIRPPRLIQFCNRICVVSMKIMTRWCMACDISSLLYVKVMMVLSSRLQLWLKAKLN